MSTIEIPVMDGVPADASPEWLASRYAAVRAFTESLTEGLAPEDMVVQSMPDLSPTKWHLAHTSWFFEQFVLTQHLGGYVPLDRTYLYLFNSYYHQAGERHCRDQRGYISRPTVAEVRAYRRHVDAAMERLLAEMPSDRMHELAPLVWGTVEASAITSARVRLVSNFVANCDASASSAWAPKEAKAATAAMERKRAVLFMVKLL